MSRQRGDNPEPGGTVHPFPDTSPDAERLTPRQRRVREVIRDALERRGYPPSMREIGTVAVHVRFGFSDTASHVSWTGVRYGWPPEAE